MATEMVILRKSKETGSNLFGSKQRIPFKLEINEDFNNVARYQCCKQDISENHKLTNMISINTSDEFVSTIWKQKYIGSCNLTDIHVSV